MTIIKSRLLFTPGVMVVSVPWQLVSTETMKEKLFVWDKNVVLFPKKINGKFVALHRLFPSIQIFSFEKKTAGSVDEL